MRSRWLGAVVFGLLLFATGCSGFRSAWREAGRRPASRDGFSGRWEGQWVSHKNGHHGRLRCIITPISEGKYQERFRATFLGILSAGYTVDVTVVKTNGGFRFEGEHQLSGFMGGLYHFEGNVTGGAYKAVYRSSMDHGVFEMTPAVGKR